jgi:hypothetical protein
VFQRIRSIDSGRRRIVIAFQRESSIIKSRFRGMADQLGVKKLSTSIGNSVILQRGVVVLVLNPFLTEEDLCRRRYFY